MFLERFREQIQRCEKRYQDSKRQRARRKNQIQKIDQGNLTEVDLSVLEERSRVNNRMAMFSAAVDSSSAREMLVPQQPQSVILERIIKTNELMSASFLMEGARVQRSVGRVVIRSASGQSVGFGTGSMISPRLLMTNNHVLESRTTASNSTIQFDFIEQIDGTELTPVEYTLAPSEFFLTDEGLDFTIVAVSTSSSSGEALATRGWTPLIEASGKAVVGERVNVIQHPGGERQQLALRQNRIVNVVGDFLHYEADTRRGSSGSPVANDSWQTAALHHAGVPERNEQGRIMLVTGVPWNGSQSDISQISWVANEGTRISRIVDHIQGLSGLSDNERALFADAFSEPPRGMDFNQPLSEGGDGAAPQAMRIDDRGRIVYTVPVEIAVGIPGQSPFSVPSDSSPANVDPKSPASKPGAPQIDENDLNRALAAFRAHESEVYYDEAADSDDINEYYDGIADDPYLVGKPLFNALHTLVRSTHTEVLSYRRARLEHLYPWIDLRPDRKLKSIYSNEGFDVDEVIRRDLEVAAFQEAALARFMKSESARNPETLEGFLDNLENSSPFNCEHVVPQSWFGKKQPMKADLHHLFTCESDCNSFRGNFPYFQFPADDEIDRPKCGRLETGPRQFEPKAGKGPVARATLYFLIRYVGMIGDESRELQRERLPILLRWHEEEPVTEYELHRNAAIRAVQGNRNPLIDYPEWAEYIDFESGFGS